MEFLDAVSWEEGRLKQRKVRRPERNYELIIYRELEDGGRTLKVVCALSRGMFVQYFLLFKLGNEIAVNSLPRPERHGRRSAGVQLLQIPRAVTLPSSVNFRS